MTTPTLREFTRMAEAGQQSALRRRIPADLETPVSVFLKLKPLGAVFLLESVEQGIQVGRYSFIGLAPFATATLREDTVAIVRDGRHTEQAIDPVQPFAALRELLAESAPLGADDLPGPFGGAVGYLSYEMARFCEELPRPARDDLDLPDYHFLFPGALAVFDHVKCEVELLVLPRGDDPAAAYGAARSMIDGILAALAGPVPADGDAATDGTGGTGVEPTEPGFNMTRADFTAKVTAAQEHIKAGDAFQIVLSQRLTGPTAAPPFQVYRALRILNPSPYLFYIDCDGFQLVGSSPEVLVKLQGDEATLNPIAGTRPRGETPAADDELADELLADEKERAEHVMLVDLGRNDLGRVCRAGTVEVDSLMQIERYSHVMHIVSRVTGRLLEGRDGFDLLRAAFPAGTVSGAPKIRAMEIVAELEGNRRGPYAGAVGYFGHRGDLDLCITIRTLILRDALYHVQAGAGIVAASDPEAEHEETLPRLAALPRAVAIAEEEL